MICRIVGLNSGFMNAAVHHWGIDDRFTARTAFPVTLLGNFLLQPNGQFYDGGLSFLPSRVITAPSNCFKVLW